MGHYRANVGDQEFLRNFVFPATTPVAQAWPDYDETTVHDILTEVARLAEGPLADAFVPGDRQEPLFDPDSHTITLPDDVKQAYRTLMEAEYWRLDLPEELGGSDAPPSVRWAVAETILGANPPLFFYMAGPLFAAIMHEMGTEEQKRLGQLMVDNQWGATMVLTEPDAGSDVGAGRTTAHLQPDGTWHIEGVKRFITSAEHDLADNIVHLVLARPVGIDGVGGPGTKGLSLFVVPKYLVHLDGPEVIGERNGVFVTGMEHKHGMTASVTCEVSFGQNGIPAVSTLVGDVHDGIAQMFRVIEYARMMVGTKAISTLSTAYLNALDYAKIRVQGNDLVAGPKSPKVTIVNHPAIKEKLLSIKAYAEGMRALVVYTARWQDRAEAARRGHPDDIYDIDTMEQVNDLLLPVVKGFGAERATEMLTQASSILGGSGYLKDYPLEQYSRDAEIDKTYEGTVEQQGLDLLFRKVLKNQFAAWTALAEDITARLAAVNDPTLAAAKAQAQAGLGVVSDMLTLAAQWGLEALNEDRSRLYAAAFNTTRILLAVGDWLVGALLVISAAEANYQATLDERLAHYAAGKTAAARLYGDTVLTGLPARLQAMRLVGEASLDIMALPEDAF